ncbi:hypothetical protein ACFQH8_18355 [Halomicroarcula sp. GCM10025710]
MDARRAEVAQVLVGHGERHEVRAADGHRESAPSLTVTDQFLEALNGLVGEVGDEDAGHCLGVLVDGTDEQPRLTVGRGDRDRLADLWESVGCHRPPPTAN